MCLAEPYVHWKQSVLSTTSCIQKHTQTRMLLIKTRPLASKLCQCSQTDTNTYGVKAEVVFFLSRSAAFTTTIMKHYAFYNVSYSASTQARERCKTVLQSIAVPCNVWTSNGLNTARHVAPGNPRNDTHPSAQATGRLFAEYICRSIYTWWL